MNRQILPAPQIEANFRYTGLQELLGNRVPDRGGDGLLACERRPLGRQGCGATGCARPQMSQNPAAAVVLIVFAGRQFLDDAKRKIFANGLGGAVHMHGKRGFGDRRHNDQNPLENVWSWLYRALARDPCHPGLRTEPFA
jgi:hypothetical protein